MWAFAYRKCTKITTKLLLLQNQKLVWNKKCVLVLSERQVVCKLKHGPHPQNPGSYSSHDATPAWYVNSDKSDNTMKVILLDFKKLPPELQVTLTSCFPGLISNASCVKLVECTFNGALSSFLTDFHSLSMFDVWGALPVSEPEKALDKNIRGQMGREHLKYSALINT